MKYLHLPSALSEDSDKRCLLTGFVEEGHLRVVAEFRIADVEQNELYLYWGSLINQAMHHILNAIHAQKGLPREFLQMQFLDSFVNSIRASPIVERRSHCVNNETLRLEPLGEWGKGEGAELIKIWKSGKSVYVCLFPLLTTSDDEEPEQAWGRMIGEIVLLLAGALGGLSGTPLPDSIREFVSAVVRAPGNTPLEGRFY